MDPECSNFLENGVVAHSPRWRHPLSWAPRWWISTPRTRSAWVAAPIDVAGDGSVCKAGSKRANQVGDEVEYAYDWDELVAQTEVDGLQLAVLPQTFVSRMCGRRKMNISTSMEPNSTPLSCEELNAPHFLGQFAHHLQVVNRYTSEWMFDALGWWPGGRPRAHSDIGTRESPVCNQAALGSRLGVLIGSKVAKTSIICAPPLKEVAGCPCCWPASEAVAKELTTGCSNWLTTQ